MSAPTSSRPHWGFFLTLAAIAVLMRLAPQLAVKLSSAGYDMKSVNYAWGFTPMLAIGLYAGAFLKERWQAVAFVLGMQLLGDLSIWALSGEGKQGFELGSLGVYVAYPLCALLGRSLSQHRSWGRVQAGSLLSCTVFFLTTNFIVWALGRYSSEELAALYPPTFGGLMKCYELGLPFAIEFISTPLFSALLFSPLGVAQVANVATEKKNDLVAQTA